MIIQKENININIRKVEDILDLYSELLIKLKFIVHIQPLSKIEELENKMMVSTCVVITVSTYKYL